MHIMRSARNLCLWAALALINNAVSAVSRQPKYKECYDMPLTSHSFGFTAQMSFGTPAQNITSILDWTWNSQYLLTTLCKGSPTNTYACLTKDQTLFNQTKSTTFKNLSTQYPSQKWNPNHFFFNLDLKVDYASDIQRIGPSTANVRFQAGDTQFQEPAAQPFDGVFGLAPVFPSQNLPAQSTFWQTWQAGQFPSGYIAFHYCYRGSPDVLKKTCNGNDAIQTLGGFNNNLIDGNTEWYNVISFPEINIVDFVYKPGFFDYWTLRLTSLSLGDKSQALNQSTGAAVVFDHASFGRGAALSANAYQNLVALVSAEPILLASPPNNGIQPFYSFDCAKIASLVPIKYQFAGSRKAWEITPKHYVTDYGNGTCVFNVRVLGDGDFILGNLGETFTMDKYIIMDFQRLRVGIADVKW